MRIDRRTTTAVLLAPFDLAGVTVTADALHTQRAHVRFLVEEEKARYLLVVKANQPGLYQQLGSLPWKDVTARRYDRERGHGRRETRATRALTVTDLGLDFPLAVQSVRILRHRTDLRTGMVSRRTVYAITDLASQQALPQRLGRLARSQWTIENRLHFVCDTTFREDAPPASGREVPPPKSAPATDPTPWQPFGTWRSTPSAPPGTAISPPVSAR